KKVYGAQLLCVKRVDEDGHVPSSHLSYDALKADVRRQAWILEHQRWRDFNEVQYDAHRGLRELKLGVEEAARRWLQPEKCSSEEVVRRVALQKFLSLLPPDAREKTSKQQPQNMEEAAIMASCFLEDNGVECDTERGRDYDTQAGAGHGYSGACLSVLTVVASSRGLTTCESTDVHLGKVWAASTVICPSVTASTYAATSAHTQVEKQQRSNPVLDVCFNRNSIVLWCYMPWRC
uniref:SCAN box domain-containing protein n=1 Tax=Electrophorus electricus TaxID=8005 RepID=A0A4W4DVH3_ELEEL